MDNYEIENRFYLDLETKRMAKMLAHYELYKMIIDKPGDIIEMGVFKGSSFMRWAKFRNIFENNFSRKIIGFDIFGEFPEADEIDKMTKEKFIASAGDIGISVEELKFKLENLGLNDNITLVKGDITQTIDTYLELNPQTKIALLHVDVDLLEPTRQSIEKFYNYMVRGGVIIFDDYGFFPGANVVIDQFLKDKKLEIKKLPFVHTPSYVIIKD
jgi:hypothetical protein